MALTAQQKGSVVKEYQRTQSDTGSPEVQIALLSARIESLGGHFKAHNHDVNSRQGLLKMVNKRRKLLDYLRHSNPERYTEVIGRLGLRK
ncbi:MAG: 30S ribosomal protein S15 [Gammaproteobacteria bacterium]